MNETGSPDRNEVIRRVLADVGGVPLAEGVVIKTIEVVDATGTTREVQFLGQPGSELPVTSEKPPGYVDHLPPPPTVRPAWMDKPLKDFRPRA